MSASLITIEARRGKRRLVRRPDVKLINTHGKDTWAFNRADLTEFIPWRTAARPRPHHGPHRGEHGNHRPP